MRSKRTKHSRRMDALAQQRDSIYANSKAKRLGTATHEEWQTRKEAKMSHLEELINGRKA
jgi:hypothetical protein